MTDSSPAKPTDPTSRGMEPSSLPANVKLLGLVSLLNDIASEMIFPLMPTFLMGALGGNKYHLGIIEGIADSTASLLKLGSGAWSDRTGGRKALIVLGYLLTACARPLVGLATVPWHLFGVRIADRIGKGVRTAPRDALIADSTAPGLRGRAFGFHRAMDHLGAAIGPALACIYLLWWPGQLRSLFLWTALPGLILVALLIGKLREPKAEFREPQPTPKPPAAATLTAPFRLYLISLVLFTLGNSSDAFLLVRAEELGVPTAYLPILWGLFHIAKSLGNITAGRAVDRFSPRPLIFVGWGIYAAIYLGFAAATQAWHVWALFLGYAVFYALTEPAEKTLVTLLVGPERKGAAFGWFNFAVGIAALPASILFGWLYQHYGAWAAFGWGAGMAVIAAGMLAMVRIDISAAK